MLRNVVVIFRHRRAHTTLIHVLAILTMKKRAAWFSISVGTCGSVPIVMKALWPWAARALL